MPARLEVQCTTITIPAGTDVRVVGGPSARRLDLRATGDVRIDGVLDLSATGSTPGPSGAVGGPGGTFETGTGGAGQGPGGGSGGAGGAFPSAAGGSGGASYTGSEYSPSGSSGQLGDPGPSAGTGGGGGGAGSGGPFSAGSGGGGGGGSSASPGGAGGAGGGGLRIVSATSISIGATGELRTRGGQPTSPASTSPFGGAGGGGSGGGIVLNAPELVNAGLVSTLGGDGDTPLVPMAGGEFAHGGDGAAGAIRLEYNSLSVSGTWTAGPPTDLPPAPPTTFSPIADRISVVTVGLGIGTVTSSPAGIDCGSDCSEYYDPGADVTLTATPAPGSAFQGWSGDCAGQGASCTLTDGLARSATANFALAAPPPSQLEALVRSPIKADGTSIFNAKRAVVPLKFVLSENGARRCDLPPATLRLTRTGGVSPGPIDESTYSGNADSGSEFRISGCQYHYNLGVRALGPGSYHAEILIDGSPVGEARFELK